MISISVYYRTLEDSSGCCTLFNFPDWIDPLSLHTHEIAELLKQAGVQFDWISSWTKNKDGRVIGSVTSCPRYTSRPAFEVVEL